MGKSKGKGLGKEPELIGREILSALDINIVPARWSEWEQTPDVLAPASRLANGYFHDSAEKCNHPLGGPGGNEGHGTGAGSSTGGAPGQTDRVPYQCGQPPLIFPPAVQQHPSDRGGPWANWRPRADR